MRSDANLTRMMHYSTDLYRKLKDETGHDPAWREVGGLRLASSAERMEDLKRLVGMAKSFGVPMDLISPKEALDMFPIMNPEGITATGTSRKAGPTTTGHAPLGTNTCTPARTPVCSTKLRSINSKYVDPVRWPT